MLAWLIGCWKVPLFVSGVPKCANKTAGQPTLLKILVKS